MIAAVFRLRYFFEFNNLFVIYVVVAALLYAFLLYRLGLLPWKQLFRVIGAKVTVAIVCNIIMTPLVMVITEMWTWEVMMSVKIPARLLKNAIQVPVDCVLLLIILFPIMAAYNRIFRNNSAVKQKKVKAIAK